MEKNLGTFIRNLLQKDMKEKSATPAWKQIDIAQVSYPDNCKVENGVLISMEITSEQCVIPEGVREIKDFAINRNRDMIRELILPSSLRYIRRHNFSSSSNLEKVVFSEGLLEIGEQAFENCDSLKKLNFPIVLI